MRVREVFILGAVLLAGCGTAPEPAERGPVAAEVVEVLTFTAVGGRPSPAAVVWQDLAQRRQWLSQFDDPVEIATQVDEVVDGTEVDDGMAAYVAVAAVGCDVPVTVEAISTDSGLILRPVMPTTPPRQCFAPMTTVVVVIADAPGPPG
jgi:hypothetical protein